MKKLLLLTISLLLLAAACSAAQVEGLQTLVAAIPGPENNGPLGGQVAALPTMAATATPPPSMVDLSTTETPSVVAPLATMTAIADLFALPSFDDPPYEIVLEGLPHFIAFEAWW